MQPLQSRQEVDGSRIPELKDIVSDALDRARALGATQAEADVSLQKGLTTTVRLGEVETVEYQRDRGMGVTVYFGKRKGSASTADLSPRAVSETVEKACDIARYTAEDDCAGLADPDELARDIPDLDLDHPWDLAPEEAVECARSCEAAGRAVDTRITNSEGATVGSHRGVRVYGNSHGFLGGYPSTSHSISCVLLAQDGSDYFNLHHTADDTLDKIDPKALAQNVAAYTVFAYLAAEAEGGFGSEPRQVRPPQE